MDGDVRASFGDRDFQLLDEKSLAADLRQRPIHDAVALRRHRHQLDGEAGMRFTQLRSDVLRLPEREAALPGRYAQPAH